VGSSASGSNEVAAVSEGVVSVSVVLGGGAARGGVGSGTGVGGGTLSFSSFSFFESAGGVEGMPNLGFSAVICVAVDGVPKLNAGLSPVAGGPKLNDDFGFSSSSIAS